VSVDTSTAAKGVSITCAKAATNQLSSMLSVLPSMLTVHFYRRLNTVGKRGVI